MSYISNWIVSITTAVFFIIAIEMILPNNSIKKYVSFILGLILIIIIIKPVIKIFDNNFDFGKYLTNAVSYTENYDNKNKYDEYKNENINSTIENFKINIENTTEKKLKEKYIEYSYEVTSDIKYDSIKKIISINSLKIGIKKGIISKIKGINKIEISKENKNDEDIKTLNNTISRNIKKYLSSEFNIPEDNIDVYEI